MNTQLGWTDLDQSKKLVEAGLDPNTADMHIIDQSYGNHGYFDTALCYSKWDAVHTDGYLPCWSLGRLIGLILYEPFISNQDGTWFVSFDVDDTHSHQFSKETLIDTVIESIIWLLEKGYIKKGE